MLDAVLAPHHEAGARASVDQEPSVPRDWPGTYCPNFSDWAPGDIVLVYRQDILLGAALQVGQAFSLNPLMALSSHLTHAGIYVGDGMMMDASWGRGVDLVSVWGYCQSRSIELRRLQDPSIPANQVAGIAAKALTHRGEPYSTVGLVLSKLWPGVQPDWERLFCSTFVALVVTEATGVKLASEPQHRPFYPSMLGRHPDLTTVLLEWRAV